MARLYRDFAWEAVMSQPHWPGLLEQPREVLERYFAEELASLLRQDRARAEKERMGRLDFLPIWDSQDPGACDLEVSQTEKPDTISVKFRYPGNDEIVKLLYQMTKTKKGWRIRNITGSDWSLLAILKADQ